MITHVRIKKGTVGMKRTVEIDTPFGRALSFVKLTGREGISQLFEYELVLTSKDANLQAADIIGQTSTVKIETAEGIRPLNGLVTDFGYLHEDPDEITYHLYRCTLRPFLWQLTQKYDSRVFVDKNVLDITNIILGEFGFNYQIKCQNSYRTYGHSIQYQEHSFNYLNRLFEQEGIYYYFEHQNGNHTLVIVDDKEQHQAIMGKNDIPYHSKYIDSGTPNQAYIDSLTQLDSLTTKTVSMNDHNYQTAKTKLNASSNTHQLEGTSAEDYDFYTNFKASGEANHYAKVRAEDYNSQSKRIQAEGNVLTIAPGYVFTLSRHPHSSLNDKHLIISATYELEEAGYASGSEESSYRISFTAIPHSYQYRIPRHTPKPKIVGSQGAIVTGPAGEEVYTNDYGDIKIQFHWDRYGPLNQDSSDWVRVIQGSAGSNFGSINTPRIGEEVLIDFINGDSDRPIVVGRLYNSANPPPWGFPAAAKQSGIKSKSFNSPLQNYNELMFDDTASKELVNLQAQKDLNSLVKNDETRHVQHDRTTTIDNDETVTVHGNRKEEVDKDETITIHQNRTETVDKDETITIHQNRKERVDKDETISIGVNRTESVGKNESISIGGNRTENVGKNENITIAKAKAEMVGMASMENVGLAKMLNVGAAYSVNVGGMTSFVTGAKRLDNTAMTHQMNAGKDFIIQAGNVIELTVGASTLRMDKSGKVTIQGTEFAFEASGPVQIVGKDIDLN